MFCQKCGTKNLDSGSFCQSCGTPIQNLNQSFSSLKTSESENLTTYAGFWVRFGAYILDSIIIGIPIFILAIILVFNSASDSLVTILQLFSIVVLWLYFAFMESSASQGTLGKKIVGIKVTDIHGNRISFGRATGRYFGKMLSGILNIGYIMAGLTEKKQALHDMMAKCLVLKK